MKNFSVALVACVALLLSVPVFAGVVVVGNPPDPGQGNSYPFGSAYDGEYQQIYNSGQFSGSITITNLEFYNTQVNFGATAMNSGTWTIGLGTTSTDWNTLNSTMSLNGATSTVFSGNLSQPWAFGDTLVINLTTPFTYNPGSGNLLMDILVSGASDAGGLIFFDTNGYNNGGFNGNTFMGRVYCPGGVNCGGVGTVNNGYGLVTGFSYTSSTTPEPSSIALFGSGILGLAGVLRRKFMA
jgi:hypothetical protein